ncbi:plexin-B-like [Antedon mediterranea]|uniref:plexin-B-like n=1 Tax=Antedon mediterranea TaxID=105859 RepID=UPI003AF53267
MSVTLVQFTIKLVKLQVANCSRFITCDECIRPGQLDADPYCGWCTLYKTCTRFKECQQSPWLPSNSAQCIKITNVEPPFIPKTFENISISLTVEQLPLLNINQNYNCKFGDFQSSAIQDRETLTCYSPPSSHVPQIPTSQAFVDVILSVHSSVTDVDFVSTDFTFYDCSVITSCSECVTSFTCDWCVYDNKCTHNASTLCTADDKIILNGNATSPPNGFQGQGSCPQIYQPNEELIHANIRKEVRIPIWNLPNATKVNSYECELEIEAQTVRIPASVDESNANITCSQYTYDYTAKDKQEVNAYIKVFWNDNEIDNAYQVTLYKCSVQRPDCSRCYSMNTTRSGLDCVWCTGDQCSYSLFCLSIVNECPSPVIIQTHPISVATVTTQPEPDFTEVIELFGTDFGQMMSDIDNIMIDNKECVIVADGFNIALQSVKCKAPVFDSVSQRDVIITVQGKTSAPVVILYQNPLISELSPRFGIQAGGTILTFSGSNLNTGNDVMVSIDGSECYVTSISENQMMCTTSNYTTSGAEVAVTVTFGNAVRDGPTFTYTTNPTVTDFQPNKGIQAGGQNIRVTGTNFQYVQKATMLLNSVSAENNCIILSNEDMDCESPPADLSTSGYRSRRQTDRTVLPLTFSFDGFVPALSGDFGFSVYPNPIYYPFDNMSFYGETVVEGIYRYDKHIDEFMKLMGSDINLASEVEDVEVFIGSVKCTVNAITSTVVLVEVPDKEPNPVDGEDHPIVKIQHGNINVTFGPIEYSSNIQVEIIVVCSVIGVAILLFFIILLIHRRRIKQYDKETKKVYVEMERIQEEVQEEAQSAFADLTVYLTDLTADDFQGIVMPFVTHKQYVCNMMFNGFEHIPDSQNKDSENITTRLQQLSELLLNKSFLLTFIKMLDSNSKVTVKEKCNIASLLVVEFLIEDKMDYFTEVLEELLIDNIDYCVSSHKAKQVLARTDSVTAKLLSNWIALSMYNYLKDYAGHPLYVLYHALKLRIEMGPVDAITGRATYSLNLDNCLQSDERPQVITLNAIQNSDSGEFQKVKVLSCDTISQVKEKILDTLYKNDPYTDRPKVQHLDLSWRHGRGGHLILSDIDATSQRNGQLIKLNTIGDLIPKAVADNGCTVALVKKQTVANADIDLNVVSPATATPAAGAASKFVFDNAALEPDNGVISMKSLEESGMKHYHLTLDNVGRSDPKRKSLFNMHRNAKRDIKEIKFLRAMATKEAIKEYVDEMFNTIFWASSSHPPIPPSVKYLFDLFDQEAKKQGVDDLTLTTWKNNSVPSKFWVQVIKHPEYIFDIKQTGPIMGTLSIISRTFIESCSPKKIQLTKESEVNRLLYTKEMPHYRSLVDNFYKKVQTAEFQRASFVQELHNSGKNFRDIFSRTSTLKHLFSYLKDHTDKLTSLLQQDEGYETQRNLRQLRSVFAEPNEESSTSQHSTNPYEDVH